MAGSYSDITIIGAGPSGSLAAWESMQSSSEASVSVLEEHSQVGLPPHCSGLISLEGFRNLGVNLKNLKRNLGYNAIRRAKFVGPNYNSVEIDRGIEAMGVFDRPALDRYIAKRTKESGCKYKLGLRIKQIKFDGSHWQLHSMQNDKKEVHRSKMLISAEGIHANLSNSIGLPVPDKNWCLPAIQYELENIQDIEPDCVELYFGRKYAPGFFGWFIPINENSARIGIAVGSWCKGQTRFFMNYFLKKHPLLYKRLRKGKIINSYGGFVPAAGPVNRTYSRNFMTVGDAAGQSKATTGGGVNIGGYCGRLAGLMARRIISDEISAKAGCREYQQRWQARFEPDLSLLKLFRRMMSPLPDKTWNSIIHIAIETDIGKSLKSTNIDLHGLGLLKYAFTPNVFIKGLRLIPQTAVSLLHGLTF
ncbi:MAG: geranylgeranyl reductase family protein [Candidatus Hodarchaeota archaeon]